MIFSGSYDPPAGSHYFAESDKYYVAFHNKMGPWRAAQNECQKKNGDLVVVINESLQQYLESTVIKFDG